MEEVVHVYGAGRNFGLADEKNPTEKSACKWPSGNMPLVEGLDKGPHCA